MMNRQRRQHVRALLLLLLLPLPGQQISIND